MKRTIFVGLGLIMVIAVLLLLPRASGVGVAAQADTTPTRFGVHWDRYAGPMAVGKPELITLYIDLEVRCDETVAISQTLDLDGPALELGEGLFREFNWDWGEWTPPNATCAEWQRIRWEVPEGAGAYDITKGEAFVGQVYGEYWPPEGRETQEDENHFWLLGPLAEEWYDACPGAPDCATPGPTPTDRPTLTPQPTYTPAPTPTCLPTPTCPSAWPTHTPYPTATRYPTNTPWPPQPPL